MNPQEPLEEQEAKDRREQVSGQPRSDAQKRDARQQTGESILHQFPFGPDVARGIRLGGQRILASVRTNGPLHVGLGTRTDFGIFKREGYSVYSPRADGSGILASLNTGTHFAVDFSGASGVPCLVVMTGNGATGASNITPALDPRVRAASAAAGNRTFQILTLSSNGAHPPIQVSGTNLTIGNQTVGFNGSQLTLAVMAPPQAATDSTYYNWIQSTGSSLPSNDRMPERDPDGDGRTNLEEYAAVTPPTGRDPDSRLTSGWVPGPDGAPRFQITYRQRAGGWGTAGLDYRVGGVRILAEYSESMASGTWHSTDAGGGSLFEVAAPAIPHGDGSETVSLRLKGPATERGFARLRIVPE